VDADVEQGLLEILKRKVASSLSMYVDTVRAFQQAYGPQALEILRARRLQAAIDAAARGGAAAGDRGLGSYCRALEQGCRGSHEWEKLEDSESWQAYRFTRCLWAEVFVSLGAADIGYWICEADGPAAAAFDPRIRFTRTQTLMQGHECCDHVYHIEQA
jgi:hypothetical protein